MRFPALRRLACFLALSGIMMASRPAVSATYYVDAKLGLDSRDGSTLEKAFRSIQPAVARLKPGDVLLVAPGVYFEHITMTCRGTPAQPITIKSAGGAARTIITGADREIRERKVIWELEDPDLGLYVLPFDGEGTPSRVLYDGVDLYPYTTLELLKTFTIGKKGQPAPSHGFTYDRASRKLYVRLKADGKYGPADPNQHTMCVAPPAGAGLNGADCTKPSHANITIPGEGASACVVIDGFTFETPGVAGVNTAASDVTVRNCIFLGCRAGVGGNAVSAMMTNGYQGCANQVSVTNCTYAQAPCYDDGVETLARDGSLSQRKGQYSIGLILRAGKNWDVGHCAIRDSYKAISAAGVEFSSGLRLHDNLVERILDNAIEMENHAEKMSIARNVIRNCFSPVSWQPADGKPWPGPIFFHQNIIYGTDEFSSLFQYLPISQTIALPPVFRIGSADVAKQYGKLYVPEIPDPGLLFFNNTVFWNRGALFLTHVRSNNPEKIRFYNNILVTGLNLPNESPSQLSFPEFVGNLCVATPPAGLDDQMLRQGYAEIGMKNPIAGEFQLMPGSRAIGKAVPVPGSEIPCRDIGALQQGETWYPLTNAGCAR